MYVRIYGPQDVRKQSLLLECPRVNKHSRTSIGIIEFLGITNLQYLFSSYTLELQVSRLTEKRMCIETWWNWSLWKNVRVILIVCVVVLFGIFYNFSRRCDDAVYHNFKGVGNVSNFSPGINSVIPTGCFDVMKRARCRWVVVDVNLWPANESTTIEQSYSAQLLTCFVVWWEQRSTLYKQTGIHHKLIV